MASYNRVVLVGNLTRDPELRSIPSGMSVLDVGIAVNDRRKDANGNWIEEATFVDVTVWGRSAEVLAEYTRKGSQILVEGRLKMDSWEQEGQRRTKLKVVAERTVLLGSRGEGGGCGYQQGGYQQSYQRQQPQRSNASNSGSSGGDYYNDFAQDGGDDIPF
ncbi:MAG: single-stranded DNA-binding protein [Thermoguttaceae bacterium]|nr:single-stranded DNA-binding protein [Thermoguttaceae bacterium]